MSEASTPQPTTPPQRGCLKGCLIGVGILFAITVIAIIVMSLFWRQLMGGMFYQTIAGQIDSTSFPEEEKEEAKAELRRFTEAFKNQEFDTEDLGRGLMVLTESPLVTLIFVNSLQHQYLRRSGLPEQELEEGRLTIERFAHGVFHRRIDQLTSERVMAPLSTRGSQGEFQLKSRVSDEQLREFLVEAKAAADSAQVPEELPPIDLSAEMRRVVDAAIAAAAREEAAEP